MKENDSSDLSDLTDSNHSGSSQKPYLSEVLPIGELKRGRANLIVAPCHSGKTTAAEKIFNAYNARSPNGLLLIDTTAGRDSLVRHQKAQRTPAEFAEQLYIFTTANEANQSSFVTMTYYEFGIYARHCPEVFAGVDVIICDEMHNLIRFLAIEEARNKKDFPDGFLVEMGEGHLEYSYALDYLLQNAASTQARAPLVVIMTATPKNLYRKFAETQTPYEVFDFMYKVRCDRTACVQYYANFSTLLPKLETKAIIYVPTIKLIRDFSELADDGTRNVMGLWSMHNTDHPMSDRQLEVRNKILQNERIPSDIDILLINAAYETSINIRNEDFQTLVVHTGYRDAQIQVRGRLRHDIKNMYLYDAAHEHIGEYFPAEYFNVPLSSADREHIAQQMGLVNSKGRPLKWSSIASAMAKNGAQIESARINNQRYYTIRPYVIDD